MPSLNNHDNLPKKLFDIERQRAIDLYANLHADIEAVACKSGTVSVNVNVCTKQLTSNVMYHAIFKVETTMGEHLSSLGCEIYAYTSSGQRYDAEGNFYFRGTIYESFEGAIIKEAENFLAEEKVEAKVTGIISGLIIELL